MGEQRRVPSHNAPEAREYVEKWAKALVAAVGKREARTVLVDYKALAGNAKLAKRDRDVAAQRAKVLARVL